MKKNVFLFLLLTLFLQSCYVYRGKSVKKGETPPTIKEQIKPNQRYKIEVLRRIYTIKAVKWEGDSLVVAMHGKKNIQRKFSSQQISHVKERQFSNTLSNTVTVMIYASLGLGLFYFLK